MPIPRLRQIRGALGRLRTVRDEGGPTRIRLERIGRPEGWIFPTSEATVEIEAASGKRVSLTPELPVPWPYAWGYRIARRLGLPLASTLDPEDVALAVPVPEFVRRRISARG